MRAFKELPFVTERERGRTVLNFSKFEAFVRFGEVFKLSQAFSHLALFLLYSYFSFSTILAILLLLL